MARLPKSFYNPFSLVGAGLALVTLFAILIFFLMEVIGTSTSPYLGIFTYMILPGIMIAGLLLIPVGAWLEKRRQRRHGGEERKYLHIDFNKPTHRFAFMIFMVGTFFLIIISAAGTYQAYTYSESVEFCGKVCHVVMKPEYVAYQHSPHARVPCAECHIGSGADWFVKAKISGSYQVYSVLFDKFTRPIETPIHNLRPARETCLHCHWPQKFSSNLEMAKTYYPLDTAAMPPWSVTLQLKIGGGHSELGPTNGIHWHMNDANIVEYVAVDKKRQEIPYVKSTNVATGKVTIYRSTEVEVSDADLAKGEQRRMDCIDCHNRPSHIYHPPFRTVNDAMAAQSIPSTLPNIRSIASMVLTREYVSEDRALAEIPAAVKAQYAKYAPEVLKTRGAEVDKAVTAISRIYQRNFFPEMNVSWTKYPNNIGHMYNDGCFRCHDGKHVSDDGKVITNDCNTCHVIIAQGPTNGRIESNIAGLAFKHPVDVGGAEATEKCTSCHTGE